MAQPDTTTVTSPNQLKPPGLKILIIGAGISGLATATALSQKHHTVTVLERHPRLNEFGASIGILSNGVRCLRSWGLAPTFESVVTKNEFMEFRNGITGDFLGHNPHNAGEYGKLRYGEEIWNINRRDYQDVLAGAARDAGAKIEFGVEIERIDVERCEVVGEDGRVWSADVIIGADGMRSVVRKAIPATRDVEPVALIQEQAWRCNVPKDRMRSHPELVKLLENRNQMCWTAPGRYVLTWPLPPNRDYDVVACVQQPGEIPVGRWGTPADAEDVRKSFRDFCPLVRDLLDRIDGCVKWTLGEVPKLKTCRSANGRVILAGDAFHAMIPHSGSGGNSAIEDAACVAECLDWAWRTHRETGQGLSEAIARASQAYEDIRKPRVERMQEASHEAYGFLGAAGDFQPIRDQALADATNMYDAELALPKEERCKRPKMKPDMHGRFPLEPYLQWLYGYDTTADTKLYMSQLRV